MDFLKEWRGKPVLVTGGTGFIGQHVLRQGVNAGVRMINISSKPKFIDGIEHYQADITDQAKMNEIIRVLRPSALLHLAAKGVGHGSANLTEMLEVNAIGLQIVLEAVIKANSDTRVIIAGSGFEYAPQSHALNEADLLRPVSPYGVSKVAATMVADYYATQVPITILRLFSIYGIGEISPRIVPYIIEQVRGGHPVELTACEQVRDYTFVNDISESFWRALILPQESGDLRIFNVGTGNTISLRTLVETLAGLLSEKGLSPDLHFGAKSYRNDEMMTYLADISLIKQVMGWFPPTSLESGLSRVVGAYFE